MLDELEAERAVVFGSYARGEADGFSDLDLVVVVPTDLWRHERGDLVEKVLSTLPVAADVLVYTPAEYARGIARGFDIFDTLAREGVTIHGRSPS